MTKTLTGTFQYPDGSPAANAVLNLKLSQDAVVLATSQIAPRVVSITLNGSGAIPAATVIYANDELSPSGTVYETSVIAVGGGLIYGPELFSLTGASPINLNSLVPVLSGGIVLFYSNPVLQNPASAQTITGFGLTLTNTAPLTVQGVLTASGGGLFSGNYTHNGIETLTYLNGQSIIFPDPLTPSSGLCSVTGTDASAKIQCAINLLPARGGTVDARNLTDSGGTGSTTIDPGTKAVTILLGPGTYNFSQVILRRALHIMGMGAYPANGTIIQATGGNSTPPFVIDQAIAAQGVILRGFALQATAGNTTQNGINLVLSANSTGLWYSEFDDLYINGFGGIGINFDSQNGQGHQFDTFKRVVVIRKASGNFALQIIGFANSFKFENCEFDGVVNTQDGLTNINIAAGVPAPVFPPYNIKFDLLTSQFAGKGLTINGADAVSIDQGHFEKVEQVFSVGTSATFGSQNITIHDSFFGNSSGIGTVGGVGVGNGYIVKNLGATGNVSVVIITSHSYSIPDVFLAGNTGSIASFGNTIGPEGSYVYQTTLNQSANGIQFAGQTFANLSTPNNGTVVYCPDCTIANPCAGSGTGAFAKRLNGVWVCN